MDRHYNQLEMERVIWSKHEARSYPHIASLQWQTTMFHQEEEEDKEGGSNRQRWRKKQREKPGHKKNKRNKEKKSRETSFPLGMNSGNKSIMRVRFRAVEASW